MLAILTTEQTSSNQFATPSLYVKHKARPVNSTRGIELLTRSHSPRTRADRAVALVPGEAKKQLGWYISETFIDSVAAAVR